MTSAPALAAKLCPDLPAAERARLEAIRYLGVVCTSVLRDRKLSDFYVTNITDPGAPFTGVIEMTALVDPKEFGGRHLLYLPRYVTPDDDFPAQSDDEIHERFVGSLERMYPSFGRDSIVAMKTSRVRYVMPIPTIDYSLKVSDIVTSLPGIFLANSSQIINGTLNVNETVQLADRAAAKVLAA
ncbi:MAG: hypothetical protein HC882_02325 [Acidobacteria bacterium]|nr:hypothetical protein [Acidobacteriota bacterium]